MPKISTNDSPVGVVIKKRLAEMERTQPWLARKSDCAVNTVNRIVKGKMKPSSELLTKIAVALEIDYEQLYSALNER